MCRPHQIRLYPFEGLPIAARLYGYLADSMVVEVCDRRIDKGA